MPNRIVREGILSSERIALLNWSEEVFYRRLMSIVDDYGRTEASPQLLRSRCYPLQTDVVRVADISRSMAACQKAGLIVHYECAGKAYLEVQDFRQQQRTESKWPAPPPIASNRNHLLANAHLDVVVVGDVVDINPMSVSAAPKPDVGMLLVEKKPQLRQEAESLLAYLNEKTGRKFRPKDATLKPILGRLKEGYSVRECRAVIAIKCKQWRADDKMRDYMRPDTLFNATKFAQYVGDVAPDEDMNAAR